MSLKKFLVFIGIVVIALHLMGRAGVFTGTPELESGVLNNRLYPCAPSDACLASRPPETSPHYIHSILPKVAWEQARPEFKNALENQGCEITSEESTEYIKFQCTTFFLRTVDDLELYHAANEGRLHVRSRARIAWLDWGRQRRRIDALRAELGRKDDPIVEAPKN